MFSSVGGYEHLISVPVTSWLVPPPSLDSNVYILCLFPDPPLQMIVALLIDQQVPSPVIDQQVPEPLLACLGLHVPA